MFLFNCNVLLREWFSNCKSSLVEKLVSKNGRMRTRDRGMPPNEAETPFFFYAVNEREVKYEVFVSCGYTPRGICRFTVTCMYAFRCLSGRWREFGFSPTSCTPPNGYFLLISLFGTGRRKWKGVIDGESVKRKGEKSRLRHPCVTVAIAWKGYNISAVSMTRYSSSCKTITSISE